MSPTTFVEKADDKPEDWDPINENFVLRLSLWLPLAERSN